MWIALVIAHGLLAFLLFPVNVALRTRLHGRNGAAALVLTVVSVIGILAPLAALTACASTSLLFAETISARS